MSQNMLGGPGDDPRAVLRDFLTKWTSGVVTTSQIKRFLRKENPFDLSAVRFDWRSVYEQLGLLAEYDLFAKANDLADSEDYWTVPVIKGVTPNLVVKTMWEKLGVQFYLYTSDLDASVTVNDREPANGSYLIRFAKNVEADEELKNQSANMLAEAGTKGITLLERLLLGMAYFVATGEHLDVKNITLCSGSRDSDGDVPSVRWDVDGRRVYVRWHHPGRGFGNLRARAAVS